MKKLTLVGLFLVGVVIFYGCSQPSENTEEKPTFTGAPLAEPTLNQPSQGQVASENQSWKTYIDDKAGFKITFPESWKDFRTEQNVLTDQNGESNVETGFGGWQPNSFYLFNLFEEPKDTYKQFLKGSSGSEFSSAYVGENSKGDKAILCFGACCNGGSGIDRYGSFEKERCAEVPSILKTFETIK